MAGRLGFPLLIASAKGCCYATNRIALRCGSFDFAPFGRSALDDKPEGIPQIPGGAQGSTGST